MLGLSPAFHSVTSRERGLGTRLALRRYQKGVGSIPTGGPMVDNFCSTVPGLNFDMNMIPTRD